jgi:hypothetical protein
MTQSRDIAAAIDQRVRQLSVHKLSDSALVDQMMGYMADLQRLWTSTTDDELAVLCDDFPGFLRYATVMENLSKALRSGADVPAHIQQLSPFAEPLKRAIETLLSDGATLEREFQQRIDESRAERFRSKTLQPIAHRTRDLEVRRGRWIEAVKLSILALETPNVSVQARSVVEKAFQDMASRIDHLRNSA